VHGTIGQLVSISAVSFPRSDWRYGQEWSHEELQWEDLKGEKNFTPGSALPDVKFIVSSSRAAAAAGQQQQQQDNRFTAGPFMPDASIAGGFQAPS
jgi:hypothetical protein